MSDPHGGREKRANGAALLLSIEFLLRKIRFDVKKRKCSERGGIVCVDDDGDDDNGCIRVPIILEPW